MKKLIYFAIGYLLLCGNYLYSQENPNVNQDISGMFNERGYSRSNSFSFDENEIINDFNGNLQLSLPMFYYKGAGDLNLDVKLNYNANVSYGMLPADYAYITGHSFNILPKYNINAPAWIVSVNGIAVQMTLFQKKLLSQGSTEISDDNLKILAEGYNLSDKLQAAGSEHDAISILMGDGSIIRLANTVNSSDSIGYVGTYYSTNKKSYSRAKVTYLSGSGFTANRKVELMLGDGITYVFEEEYIEYKDVPSSIGGFNKPQSLYLKEIQDRFGNKITISYAHAGVLFGRKEISNIFCSWMSTQIDFEYSSINNSGVIICENNIGERYKIYTEGANLLDSSFNRLALVNKVENPVGKTMTFGYGDKQIRKFIDAKYGDGGAPSNYTLHFTNSNQVLKRLVSFTNYNGGRRTYAYYGENNLELNTIPGGSNKTTKSNSAFFEGQGRDPFYTNMLSKKLQFDKNKNTPYRTEEFTYDFTDASNDFLDKPVDPDDTYKAIRSVYSHSIPDSLNFQSPVNMVAEKIYKNYVTYDRTVNLENSDWPGEVKLIQEIFKKNSSEEYKRIDYQFSQGANGNLSTGSFLDTAITEIYPSSITRKSTYRYTHQSNFPLSNASDNPITQRSETDHLGKKTVTDYLNIFDNSTCYNNSYYTPAASPVVRTFYQIQIPQKIETSNGGVMLAKKSFEILNADNDNKAYIGQILKSIEYDAADTTFRKITENTYYKKDTLGAYLYTSNKPTPEGKLKQIKSPNGSITNFYHHPQKIVTEDNDMIEIVSGIPKVKYKELHSEGSTVNKSDDLVDIRMPVRIDQVTAGGVISSFNKYDEFGNLILTFDRHSYATSFKYDKLSRLTSAVAPYDFSSQTDSSYYSKDTTYIPFIDTVVSNGWGNKDANNGAVQFSYSSSALLNGWFSLFYDIAGGPISNPGDIRKDAYFSLEDFRQYPIHFIDTAQFIFHPVRLTASVNGSPPSSDVKLKIQPLKTLTYTYPSTLTYLDGGYTSEIPFSSLAATDTQHACGNIETKLPWYKNIIDVTATIRSHFLNSETLQGFKLYPAFENFQEEPQADVSLELSRCIEEASSAGVTVNEWLNSFSPRFIIKGVYKKIDSSLVIVPRGTTISYVYDDGLNKVSAYNKISGSLYKRSDHLFDGFYRIKESRNFTNGNAYNSFLTSYNYLDQKAKSTDAAGNIVKTSYDEFGRAFRTDNPDTSFIKDSTTFLSSLITNLDTFSFAEKRVFTDETGRNFEKYFDAAGNLVREHKYAEYIADAGNVGSNPTIDDLITDYKYDDMYRLIQVRTPEGKNIYYSYDGYGRQVQRAAPDAGIQKFRFDRNDNLVYSQYANQLALGTMVYTFRMYDAGNRLTVIGETPPSGGIHFDSLIIGDSLIQHDNPNTADLLTVNVYDTITNNTTNVNFTVPTGYHSVTNNSKGRLVGTAFRTRKTDLWSFKFYRYDARGRVIKMWEKLDGLEWKEMEYTYNSSNQYLKTLYNTTGSDGKIFENKIDTAGRLYSSGWYVEPSNPDTVLDNPALYKPFVEYTFNNNSLINSESYLSGKVTNTYSYTNRNWINYMWGNSPTVFTYVMYYFKNGNIDSVGYTGSYNDNFTSNSDIEFDNSYDLSNRLLSSNQTTSSAFDVHNSYDKDGNHKQLKRYNSSGSLEDNFSYIYQTNKNRLTKVSGTRVQFLYDSTGNVIRDDILGISGMKYDHRNLLIEHTRIISGETFITRYYYDEQGNRTRKVILKSTEPEPETPNWDSLSTYQNEGDDSPGAVWFLKTNEHYVRDVNGKELAIYTNSTLDQWNIFGKDNAGKVEENNIPYFYLKDHLGSIRAVVDSGRTVVASQDFDMWGYTMTDRTYNISNAKYDFTGKERDTETGLDYFGARYLHSRIGRWTSTDPLFEKHFDYNPYNYVLDNTLLLVDPDGKQVRALQIKVDGGGGAVPIPSVTQVKSFTEYFIDLINVIGFITTTHEKFVDRTIFVIGEDGELEYPVPLQESIISEENTEKSENIDRSKQTKKLSDNEVKRLEEQEGKHIHEIKREYVKKKGGHFDVYRDPKTKEIYLKPKSGKGSINTGLKLE